MPERLFAKARVENLKFSTAITDFVMLLHKVAIEKSVHQYDFSISPPFLSNLLLAFLL